MTRFVFFRQTPFFLIPTVITFTAFLPSSTWQLPLTSHRRNDCEYTKIQLGKQNLGRHLVNFPQCSKFMHPKC